MKDIALFGMFAPLILFFQQARNTLKSIFTFFWKTHRIPYMYSYQFYKKLNEECYRVPLNNWTLDYLWLFKKGESSSTTALYKKFSLEIFLYKKFIPLIVKEGNGNENFNFSYLNFTYPFTQKLIESSSVKHERWNTRNFWVALKQGVSSKTIEHSKQAHTNRATSSSPSSNSSPEAQGILSPYTLVANKLLKLIGTDPSDVCSISTRDARDKYIFTKQGMEVRDLVKKWLNSQSFYEERNITFKYGIMLSGEPGSGKSSVIKEIARDLDLPLFIFDLSTMDNQEFEGHLKDLPFMPSIILFEDICSIFNGRENITKTQHSTGITFDFFINRLSGVDEVKNKLIFATTNHIEKLDPALLRRFDKVVKFNSMDIEEKYLYVNKMTKNQQLIEQLLQDGKDDSNAVFEQRVIEAVLNEYWKDKV